MSDVEKAFFCALAVMCSGLLIQVFAHTGLIALCPFVAAFAGLAIVAMVWFGVRASRKAAP